MGGDIGSGSATGYHLWSLCYHRWHTQLHWAALQQKSKQTEPKPISSPINYPAYCCKNEWTLPINSTNLHATGVYNL